MDDRRQGDLFSFAGDAKAKKEAVLEQVASNAGSWMGACQAALAHLAADHPGDVHTGESLRFLVEKQIGPPHHHNAWGAAIACAVRHHVLEHTRCWVPMKGPKSNARRTPEYRLVRS